MPNWCENSLSVIGEKNEVKKLYEKGLEKGSEKDSNEWGLFPYHPYDGEWDYKWCNDNWGTKWDVDLSDYGVIEIEDGAFFACFDTAWAPPIKWLEKVQADYPTLTFELEYIENGMQFKGKAYTIHSEEGVSIFDEELLWVSPYGGKVKFSDIEWDIDDDTVELPKEVILEVDEIDADFEEDGADILSDKYGFCVKTFNYEIIHKNDDDL